MMDRRLVLVPLLALAGTSLSGCVAVAIPALAGAGIVGSQVDGDGPSKDKPVASRPSPQVAAAVPPTPAPVPKPTVTVLPSAASSPMAGTVTAAPAARQAPGASPASLPASAPANTVPAQPTPMPPASPPTVAASAASIAPAASSAPTPALPTPVAAPSVPRAAQAGFAQFVRYGRGVAAVSAQATGPLSAMLADPVALDGQRQRCEAGDQPVAVIDLDPQDGVFAPPARPQGNNGLTLGLAVLRESGVQIAWLSDLPVAQIGAVRTALEQSGLDPRGEDIVSLSRDPEDRKQSRRENLAANACVIAIAGDEKPDFDERFKYLKNPEAGAALETAIGDGWFLIEPVLATNSPVTGTQEGPQDQ